MAKIGGSYDYSRRIGIRPIDWHDFHGLCKAIAAAVAHWQPEIILPVGRGGYYPGTLVSHILQAEVFPVRLTRRVNDVVQFATPRWLTPPPDEVNGQRVLIVDEICSTGETILLVREEAMRQGAKEIRSAVLYAHSWAAKIPDYIGLITDELVMNPWDREIFRDGMYHFHPEYAAALDQQGIAVDSSLLVPTPDFELAKNPTTG